VGEAAVIGIPDEHAGELPRAYVVKKPGLESVSDAEIQAFVDSKVSPHKQIKGGIEFCATIPKNNMGKILRRELRVQYANSQTKDLMGRIYSSVDSTAKKMSE
jgi:acyl-coenzyme A synthetase/AMP-(fatty) acid ligase